MRSVYRYTSNFKNNTFSITIFQQQGLAAWISKMPLKEASRGLETHLKKDPYVCNKLELTFNISA
jgi:hypothetical protein